MRFLFVVVMLISACKTTSSSQSKAVGSEKIEMGSDIQLSLPIIHVANSKDGDIVEAYACIDFDRADLRPKLFSDVKESKSCSFVDTAPLDYVQKHIKVIPEQAKLDLENLLQKRERMEKALHELAGLKISYVEKNIQQNELKRAINSINEDIYFARRTVNAYSQNMIDLDLYRADVIAWNYFYREDGKLVWKILQAVASYNNDKNGRFRLIGDRGKVVEFYVSKSQTLEALNTESCPDGMSSFLYKSSNVKQMAVYNLELNRVIADYNMAGQIDKKSGCEFNYIVNVCDIYEGKAHCREENSRHCYEIKHPGIFTEGSTKEVSEGLFRKICRRN